MDQPALLLGLAFGISLLSGWLGIGGGIIMAPALLYLPTLLGFPPLDMKTVTGLTITQGLFASLSGAAWHQRSCQVNRRLVVWMGGSLAAAALAGSVVSRWIADGILMALFAGMALVGAVLMIMPTRQAAEDSPVDPRIRRGVGIAIAVGLLGGMVGQGGSFLLIPLMLHVLGMPTRAAIGSSLAIVFVGMLAAFAGKAVTGQIPLLPGVALAIGALAGAQLGGLMSRRTHPGTLRVALAMLMAVSAVWIGADATLWLLH